MPPGRPSTPIRLTAMSSRPTYTDKQVASTTFIATFVRDCERISPLMRFLASAAGVAW